MSDHMTPVPGMALRLTFRISGSNMEPLDRQRLAMAVLPSSSLETDTPQSGFWFELQDAQRQPLYRWILKNPLLNFLEVRSENPEEPLSYQEAARPSEGVFSVVVPDLPDGDFVAFMASQPYPTMWPQGSIQRYCDMSARSRRGKSPVSRFSLGVRPMTNADGRVLGMQEVVAHGQRDLLLNLVLVAEGFQEQEMGVFAQYAQRFTDRLFLDQPVQ